MDSLQHHLDVLDLTVGPDLLSASIGEEVILTCTITNQKPLPFRLRRDWTFTQDGDPGGTLKCDITLDFKVYNGSQAPQVSSSLRSWRPEDIVVLKLGESHAFTANLTDSYPLLDAGTYTLQVTFHPEKLKGVMVSKCKPILSNLITIEIW
jgi:hypothetical protein